MAKKRKIRIDRLIIVILSFILILGLVGVGVYKLFGLFFNNVNKSNNTPKEIETSEIIQIDLVDYEIYKDDTNKFGYNFIVAKLNFVGKDSVSFNLHDLQTSEKVFLGSVNKNIDELEAAGYKISELNIVECIESNDSKVTCNIFIPFTTDNNSLQLYNVNNPEISLSFDLTKTHKYFTSLKFDTNQEIKIDDSIVSVSKSSVSTIMEHNGQEYNVASTNKVFTFKILVSEVKDDLSIVDAYFIQDGNDTKIHCMSEEYCSAKIDNILNRKLSVGDDYALFFEVYAPEQKPNYDGVLMIKFSNSNDWVEIPTVLQ